MYNLNDASFDRIALELFEFQYSANPVYRRYVDSLAVTTSQVDRVGRIPFMPISFFKRFSIRTGDWQPETVFKSSGTTGSSQGSHLIDDLSFYQRHTERCFFHFFGDAAGYNFFALLPTYLEQKASSLIAMMKHFIALNREGRGGFYLNDLSSLLRDLAGAVQVSHGLPSILFATPFSLLDLLQSGAPPLSGFRVMETGGMKGLRQEMVRQELHETVCRGLGIGSVLSEYGMTELLSQAYSTGSGMFRFPPWARVRIRSLDDPLWHGLKHQTGGINVIDLANIHSIAFVETEDLGRLDDEGYFEVLGRMDNADLRGCNLLIG